MKAKHQTHTEDQPSRSGSVVFLSKPVWSARRKALWIILVVLVLAVCGLMLWNHQRSLDRDRSVFAAEERTLQSSLTDATNKANSQEIVSVTSQLISGRQDGRFTIDSGTLAQYYMDRGTAYLNLNQNAKAVPDLQKARSVDTSVKQASLQGEVRARYALGQRRQLIPLFQQLADLAAKSVDQRAGTPELYQYYIQAIQHNKDIQL